MIFVITGLFKNSLFAQHENNSVKVIKKYIRSIDSLIENDHNRKYIITHIEEGDISAEIVKTTVGENDKVDTVKEKLVGGWSKYTFQNKKADTVYKIIIIII